MIYHIPTSFCFANQSGAIFNIYIALSTTNSNISWVFYWSRKYANTNRFSKTAFSHISWFSRWSKMVIEMIRGEFESKQPFFQQFYYRSLGSYTHGVLNPITTVLQLQFFQNFFFIRPMGLILIRNKFLQQMFFSMTSLNISWVLHLSGTYFNANDNLPTSLSHISWVLYWSRLQSKWPPSLILLRKKQMLMHLAVFQRLFHTSLGP